MADSFAPAKIRWAANAELGLDDFELTVPAEIRGRVDIWKVPVCEAYPEGIFVGTTSGQWYCATEPGCEEWKRTLLVKVQFMGVPVSREDTVQNTVVFCIDGLDMSASDLNPNDFSELFPEEEV